MATENTQVDQTDEEIPVVEEKTKNPKRVEQGKRLVEWNRTNKANPKAPTKPKLGVKKPMPENYWVLGGVIVVGGIVVGTLYFISRGTEVSSPEVSSPVPDTPQTDPFDMA